jgi:adhesin transport system outer membrane protein
MRRPSGRSRHGGLRRGCSPLAAAALLLCGATCARAESIEELVRFALENHPRAQSAAAGRRAAEFDLTAARSTRYPQISVVADPGREYDSDGGDSTSVGDLGLRASVMLYDGGRTRSAVTREESRIAAADALANVTSEELAAQIVDLYAESFKQDRLAGLAGDNVAAHEALYERVRQIVELDRGRASDLIQVGTRLEQARLQLASRRGAATEARAVLSNVVGRPVRSVEGLRDPPAGVPASVQDSISLLEQHPSTVAADAQARAAEQDWRSASAWAQPRIDLQGTLNSPQDLFGNRQYFETYDVRLAVNWAPWDGGSGRAASRSAEAQYLRARADAQSVRRDLSTRVAEIWAQIATRRDRTDTFRRLVDQAVQVREAYWQQFTIGRRSIIDLLNAENESFQARVGAENERLELLQSQYRLLAATGRLAAALGVESVQPDMPAEPRP